MKIRPLIFTALVATGSLFLYRVVIKKNLTASDNKDPFTKNEEKQAAHHKLRWKYEADMIKDPVTGMVPAGMREQEIEFAKTIPVRNSVSPFSNARTFAQNNYLPAGPNNIGGRTRALAYDIRYDGSTNRVIMAGSVSGGIYRTADGGTTWTRVSPANEIHNLSSIAQDPRPGNQDTWYAGGGEYVGSSTDAGGAIYLGYGLYKSTDNGLSWTRLPLNNITNYNGASLGSGLPERLDHPFDYVHKIAVNPVNGDLYVAGYRRVVKSSNGGTSFQVIFGSAVTAFAANGQCDVVVSPTGKIYIAFNGSSPDFTLRGVWRSTTGNYNSFTRLAGGSILGTDSVANWRGNSYNFFVEGGLNFYDTRRILLALAPSNENILYTVYENGLTNTSSGRNKEADLFKLDMTSGNTWTNLSANLPDFPGGDHDATDPFTIQTGYDLFIGVKPNDPNFILLGGTSLYRSTNGFSSTATTSWIGGYGNTLPNLTFYNNSHPDIHNVVFSPNPATPNEVLCANDGGLQRTSNITASGSTVVWNNLNNYQTLQYYRVTIDPETGANNFAGGSQDNGTHFRDKTGIAGLIATDSNNHRRLIGGDGGSVGISKRNGSTQFLYGSVQLGTLRRGAIQSSFSVTDIKPTETLLTPSGSGRPDEYGEFVTNFKLNPDNTEDLYYVNFNRLFRTLNASIVTASGWTELAGVSSTVSATNGIDISIRSLAFSRGAYSTTHALYMGTTDGRVFRLDNPRFATAASTPVNITPPVSVADLSGLTIQDISVNPNNDNEILMVVSNYGRSLANGSLQNITNILWTNNAKSASPAWYAAEGNLIGTSASGYISARSCMITVKKDATNNPVTEYYVGTAAGLFAVANLGTTLVASGTPAWQREAVPVLNFAVISAIDYRPADNVMVVGTHGNGLYYTFLGTPNLVTGINNPILNDKNFITMVYPTVTDNLVQYRVGNKFEVKKISLQLYNMQGQQVYRREDNYSDGNFDLGRFARGAYILSIYSDNRKYRHVQKLVR